MQDIKQIIVLINQMKIFLKFKNLKKIQFLCKYVCQIFEIVLEFYKICKNYIPNFDKKFGV